MPFLQDRSAAVPDPHAGWSPPRKVLFRICSVYFVLYALAQPYGVPLEDVMERYDPLIRNGLVP